MIFMNFVDVYDVQYDEEGKSHEYIKIKDHIMPVDIAEANIHLIKPFITNKGRLYKNVSIITDSSDRNFKVHGNYKSIIEKVYGRSKIGFHGKESKNSKY